METESSFQLKDFIPGYGLPNYLGRVKDLSSNNRLDKFGLLTRMYILGFYNLILLTSLCLPAAKGLEILVNK